jgi:hypothetical protein
MLMREMKFGKGGAVLRSEKLKRGKEKFPGDPDLSS